MGRFGNIYIVKKKKFNAKSQMSNFVQQSNFLLKQAKSIILCIKIIGIRSGK